MRYLTAIVLVAISTACDADVPENDDLGTPLITAPHRDHQGSDTVNVAEGKPSTVSEAQAPPAPVWTFDTTEVTNDLDEAVTMVCRTLQDAAARKRVQNCSTAAGTYALFTRGDLGLFALTYFIDGHRFCRTVPQAPDLTPAFDDRGFAFLRRGLLANADGSYQAADVYFQNPSKYPMSYYFVKDAVTNTDRPALFDDILFSVTTLHWSTTVDPNSSRFDLPPECGEKKQQPSAVDSANLSYKKGAYGSAGRMVVEPREKAVLVDEKTSSAFNVMHLDLSLPVPASVDNRRHCTPLRNQGSCGGCWTFASSALAEIIQHKTSGSSVPPTAVGWLAPQALLDCVHPNISRRLAAFGCFGGQPSEAIDYMVANGIATEATYRYDQMTGRYCNMQEKDVVTVRPLGARVVVPALNATAMMQAIAHFGAVIVEVNDAPFVFWAGDGGSEDVFDDPSCTPDTAHVVLVVGYGTTAAGKDYWIIRNSWGGSWGNAGYILMRRGVNMCGVEQFPVSAAPLAPG